MFAGIVKRKFYYATLPQELRVTFIDPFQVRVELRNNLGNLMFDGTIWLYEQCLQRGWFCERSS